MAITITKRLLSGSIDGIGIGITSTQGAGNITIHTASSGSTGTIDEVFLYAQNNFSKTLNIVFEFGTSATQSTIVASVGSFGGPELIIPGFLILGSATAANDITAYLDTTESLANSGVTKMIVYGYVNRLVQS